ncbi:acetyl-CoA carboxylase biotin carboxyl carrier protein [Novosphingobium sp. SG751A]|uniref:acetyl-CoA carboxylase biotin carboxyl carrier protein n=1 Tax=Novosphingobium sp. SG751A TaxID=2587000 RepID=UPI00155208FF|nr:biotin/lipoyl-containing protein [Novosphingobium sp. SG751A]NOW46412.1 acetyl-CoA carboxylase biotin carboxyl carrier protein [Novosphingobium sp. SG751A]
MSAPFLSPEDVGDIVAILDGSDYRELDIATTRFRLKVRRDEDGGGWSQEWQWAAQHAPVQTAGVAAPDTPEGLVAIRAPLPGTFYRAPAPGAAPFVELGSQAQPDTVVGIVETMKLMNPVHAGVSGEIVAFVAGNAEAIGHGAALIHIRPAPVSA